MRSHKRERFLLYLWNICNKCSRPSWRLDTYQPLHVFESHRTHTSYLGTKRRGGARRSLTAVSRPLGLGQMRSWGFGELVAMAGRAPAFSPLPPAGNLNSPAAHVPARTHCKSFDISLARQRHLPGVWPLRSAELQSGDPSSRALGLLPGCDTEELM